MTQYKKAEAEFVPMLPVYFARSHDQISDMRGELFALVADDKVKTLKSRIAQDHYSELFECNIAGLLKHAAMFDSINSLRFIMESHPLVLLSKDSSVSLLDAISKIAYHTDSHKILLECAKFALHKAVEAGDWDKIDLLMGNYFYTPELEQEALNYKNPISGKNLMHYGVSCSDDAVLEFVLSLNPSEEVRKQKDTFGVSPLQLYIMLYGSQGHEVLLSGDKDEDLADAEYFLERSIPIGDYPATVRTEYHHSNPPKLKLRKHSSDDTDSGCASLNSSFKDLSVDGLPKEHPLSGLIDDGVAELTS